MALRRGSASPSETSVMGIVAAWAQTAATAKRGALLTIAIVTGISAGKLAEAAALVFGVKFATNQGNRSHQIHPHQQGDTGADGTVHYVVVAHVAHIPSESGSRRQPQS